MFIHLSASAFFSMNNSIKFKPPQNNFFPFLNDAPFCNSNITICWFPLLYAIPKQLSPIALVAWISTYCFIRYLQRSKSPFLHAIISGVLKFLSLFNQILTLSKDWRLARPAISPPHVFQAHKLTSEVCFHYHWKYPH